jgi:hypothetical protein
MKIGVFCIFDHWPEVKSVQQYLTDFLDITQRAWKSGAAQRPRPRRAGSQD